MTDQLKDIWQFFNFQGDKVAQVITPADDWKVYLAAFGPLILAGVLAYYQIKLGKRQNLIAERAAAVAELDYRVNLFEKRFAVYQQIQAVVSKFYSAGITDKQWEAFNSAIAPTPYLFDADIHLRLDQLIRMRAYAYSGAEQRAANLRRMTTSRGDDIEWSDGSKAKSDQAEETASQARRLLDAEIRAFQIACEKYLVLPWSGSLAQAPFSRNTHDDAKDEAWTRRPLDGEDFP
ncbi:MAG: hypothetical protein EON54_04420 [Alcaligenaceae bacterium]|nr:MAG: hypothetical protein EON54_04420 [Alcaligenaceae bacterium]